MTSEEVFSYLKNGDESLDNPFCVAKYIRQASLDHDLLISSGYKIVDIFKGDLQSQFNEILNKVVYYYPITIKYQNDQSIKVDTIKCRAKIAEEK